MGRSSCTLLRGCDEPSAVVHESVSVWRDETYSPALSALPVNRQIATSKSWSKRAPNHCSL